MYARKVASVNMKKGIKECVCAAKRDWRLKILLGELHWGLQLRQMQRRSNNGQQRAIRDC